MGGVDICGLVAKGGVFYDVEGGTPAEVYRNVCRMMRLPEGYDAGVFAAELEEREKILSTAVGRGIAIPHPRRPLARADDDQLLAICFPRESLDMHAPDGQKVFVMFILLNRTPEFHLQVLSALAKVLHGEAFREFLASRPAAADLLARLGAAPV